MTDKMRDDFEAKVRELNPDANLSIFSEGGYVFEPAKTAWLCYQAATEQSTAKIAELQGRIDELVEVLKTVNTAVKHGVGASIKDSLLERRIYEAIAKVKDVK